MLKIIGYKEIYDSSPTVDPSLEKNLPIHQFLRGKQIIPYSINGLRYVSKE